MRLPSRASWRASPRTAARRRRCRRANWPNFLPTTKPTGAAWSRPQASPLNDRPRKPRQCPLFLILAKWQTARAGGEALEGEALDGEAGAFMVIVQVIVGGLLLGAIYALFSSGLTLIWGMMNFINFAHGEFVMLGMYVALLTVTWLGGGPPVFGLAAALALFVLGVGIYVSLIRHVIRGPMLAQILSTFGLALLLRYLAFWIFTANFKTLPQDLLPGVINVGGILIGVPQFVAGIVAIVLTVGLHLLLTRTAIGSQLLAVAEDRQAAMLMGIRPDRMQAIA